MRLIDADLLLKDMKEDPLFPLVERYNMTGKVEAQPTVDAVTYEEWFTTNCETCKEYDKEKHCCPKFRGVIKQTLKDFEENNKIVRCEDCKHRDKCHKTIAIREYDKDIECSYARFEKLTFCSFGEREEG